MDKNFLIVGVGGQGALLASNVISEVGVRAGLHVKKAEIHGMSQRGGSVNSHVRWGESVKSPVIPDGEVDVLFSLEKLETLRYLDKVRKGALVLIGEFKIPPLSVSSGQDRYPDDDEINKAVSQVTSDYHFVPSLTLAEKAGSTRAHNVVLLGALSSQLAKVPESIWQDVISEFVPPKFITLNHQAFVFGREV